MIRIVASYLWTWKIRGECEMLQHNYQCVLYLDTTESNTGVNEISFSGRINVSLYLSKLIIVKVHLFSLLIISGITLATNIIDSAYPYTAGEYLGHFYLKSD